MKDNKVNYPYAYGMCDSMLRDMAWRVKRECYRSEVKLSSELYDLIERVALRCSDECGVAAKKHEEMYG